MITVLTWVSLIAGGILVLLLVLSVLSGLDLDLDIGGTDVDTDSGGLGIVKGILTFVSVGSWVIKIMMATNYHPGFAILIGVVCGGIALLLLNYLLRLLLRNEENVNWHYSDALYAKGTVYLKIPSQGSGMVTVNVNGARREIKARSIDEVDIPTGAQVVVADIDGEVVLVREENTKL